MCNSKAELDHPARDKNKGEGQEAVHGEGQEAVHVLELGQEDTAFVQIVVSRFLISQVYLVFL